MFHTRDSFGQHVAEIVYCLSSYMMLRFGALQFFYRDFVLGIVRRGGDVCESAAVDKGFWVWSRLAVPAICILYGKD